MKPTMTCILARQARRAGLGTGMRIGGGILAFTR